MVEKLLTQLNFPKNKKFILASLIIFTFIIALSSYYYSRPVKNAARSEMVLTIPTMGNLPDLKEAMDSNATLRGKVKEVLSYDEAYLFVNHQQINASIAEIMFLWIGITPEKIQSNKYQTLIEIFIRKRYGLPDDEPIPGNPLLEKKPWANLFQKIKAKILMQGHGYKIYDGVAYYDSQKDKMVIEGQLSKEFAESLSIFMKSQPQEKQKAYANNYLLFIGETLGFKNLSDDEKKMLKKYEFY